MKTRHLLMLVVLAGATWLAIFGDKSPDTEAAAPATLPPSSVMALAAGESAIISAKTSAAESQRAQEKTEIQILPLQPRASLVGSANGSGKGGLFSGKSSAPLPDAAKLASAPAPALTAPPLPFSYLGKQISGGHMEVFLASADEVFVVRDHSVIKNIYRVDAIRPPILSLTYLPLNEVQRLSIGVTN